MMTSMGVDDGESVPHRRRRREMLRKYPSIRDLYGYDPWLAVRVAFVVTFQLTSFLLLSKCSNWLFLGLYGYLICAPAQHWLVLSLHEIGHQLAFGQARRKCNAALAIVANLPLIVPGATSFRIYHHDHHIYQVRGCLQTAPKKSQVCLVLEERASTYYVSVNVFLKIAVSNSFTIKYFSGEIFL